MSYPVLLVSDTWNTQTIKSIRKKQRPRLDYLEVARAIHADSLGYHSYASRGRLPRSIRRFEQISKLDFGLAYRGARMAEPGSVVVSFSEKIGLPFALWVRLLRSPVKHVCITHHLLSRRKRWLLRLLSLRPDSTWIITLTQAEKQTVRRALNVRVDHVVQLFHTVDSSFYTPAEEQNGSNAYFALSVGAAKRDLATLTEAAAQSSIPVKLRASSAWEGVQTPNDLMTTQITPLPTLSYRELRQLYAESSFVVIPLQKTSHATAGTTVALEAMAMGKAVVATDTPGMREYLGDGRAGHLVPYYDSGAMAEAMIHLRDNPHAATELGRAGRRLVEEVYAMPHYTRRMSKLIGQVASA